MLLGVLTTSLRWSLFLVNLHNKKAFFANSAFLKIAHSQQFHQKQISPHAQNFSKVKFFMPVPQHKKETKKRHVNVGMDWSPRFVKNCYTDSKNRFVTQSIRKYNSINSGGEKGRFGNNIVIRLIETLFSDHID